MPCHRGHKFIYPSHRVSPLIKQLPAYEKLYISHPPFTKLEHSLPRIRAPPLPYPIFVRSDTNSKLLALSSHPTPLLRLPRSQAPCFIRENKQSETLSSLFGLLYFNTLDTRKGLQCNRTSAHDQSLDTFHRIHATPPGPLAKIISNSRTHIEKCSEGRSVQPASKLHNPPPPEGWREREREREIHLPFPNPRRSHQPRKAQREKPQFKLPTIGRRLFQLSPQVRPRVSARAHIPPSDTYPTIHHITQSSNGSQREREREIATPET